MKDLNVGLFNKEEIKKTMLKLIDEAGTAEIVDLLIWIRDIGKRVEEQVKLEAEIKAHSQMEKMKEDRGL